MTNLVTFKHKHAGTKIMLAVDGLTTARDVDRELREKTGTQTSHSTHWVTDVPCRIHNFWGGHRVFAIRREDGWYE